ncbi:MAG: NAD(+)/NADH kinase [Acutalibacteraceae bacterium]
MKDGFLIIPDFKKKESVSFSEKLSEYFESKKIRYDICEKDDIKSSDYRYAVVLGGDGTVLEASRELIDRDIPIIGINFGHLGYLSTCEPDNAFGALDSILEGDCRVEKRITLHGSIIRKNEKADECIAVNEITIHRGTISRSLSLDLNICGEYIDSFRSDGILVSTPTGSTAYNLSAGGPIISPETECFIITQICAHSLKSYPIVTSAEDTVEIRVADDVCRPLLVADNCEPVELIKDDRIVIVKSEKQFKSVKLNSGSFYRTLRIKMSQR